MKSPDSSSRLTRWKRARQSFDRRRVAEAVRGHTGLSSRADVLASRRRSSKPLPFDCGGVILRQERGSPSFRIKTVIPGTPAAEAGLASSDVIEQVNGMPAAQWTMETLEAALSEPGRTFDLLVADSNGAKRTVKLLTRALV